MGASATVWIIDDDDSVRRSLVRLIRAAGMPTQAFRSAREFLDAAPPGSGCLLVDLHMPGISGLELLDELDRGGNRRPAIVLSASAEAHALARGSRRNVVERLVKPVEDDVLLDSIRAACAAAEEEERQ
jgi:FixJ family two-component response regulator